MDMTPQGLAVVRAFEGRALTAYKDPVGVWTIGFGITNAAKWAVAYLGRAIGPGLKITEEQAEYLLQESIRRSYGPQVANTMGVVDSRAYDAGVDFHWNTGAIARASWVKTWKANHTAPAIRTGLLSWNKAGGKVLAGLTRRRSREADIILKGDYGPEGRVTGAVAAKPGTAQAPVTGAPVAPSVALPPVAAPDHPLVGTPGMLRLDDSGPEVAELNAALALIGMDVTPGAVFTLKTDAAVRAFQKAHTQLNSDGVVGPATRAAITREADAKRKLKNVAVTTVPVTGGAAVTDAAAGLHLPMGVYILAAVIIVSVIGYFVWQYRDELAALAKRK